MEWEDDMSRYDKVKHEHRTTNVYGFDTETDHDDKTAWIVQWAVSDGKEEWTGRTAAEFRDWLIDFATQKEQGKFFFYIHNLKYDLEFIKYGLYDIAYRYNCYLSPIMRNGQPISVSLIPSNLCPWQCKITFRDSAKKIPGQLRELGRTIGLEKLEGVSEDFAAGWSERVNFDDPAEWEYVKRDARIVAVAMRNLHRDGSQRATASGDAWIDAKATMCGTGPHQREYWTQHYPILGYALDARLRKCYWGGINISQHRGVTTAEDRVCITHEDVHSMYPTVMMFDELPYGMPIYLESMPKSGIWIGEVRIKLHLKDGMIPWFQFKCAADNLMEGIDSGTPVIDTTCWHELTITSVDLWNLSRFYDIDFDDDYEACYWAFKSEIGYLKPYLDKWFKAKKEAANPSLERTVAKLRLNSVYGRFGLSCDTEDVKLVRDPATGECVWVSEASIEEEQDNYIPMAAFITAYARARLCDNILLHPGQVIHCDTDSVIHIGLESDLIGHTNELGDWGIESRPWRIYEGGFKRYIEIMRSDWQQYLSEDVELEEIRKRFSKTISVACAGVPQRTNHLGVPIGMWVQLIDDPEVIIHESELGSDDYCIRSDWLRKWYAKAGMDPDHVNTLKLLPRKVMGGVILEGHKHKLDDCLVVRINGRRI